jgi:hypothetical protein
MSRPSVWLFHSSFDLTEGGDGRVVDVFAEPALVALALGVDVGGIDHDAVVDLLDAVDAQRDPLGQVLGHALFNLAAQRCLGAVDVDREAHTRAGGRFMLKLVRMRDSRLASAACSLIVPFEPAVAVAPVTRTPSASAMLLTRANLRFAKFHS